MGSGKYLRFHVDLQASVGVLNFFAFGELHSLAAYFEGDFGVVGQALEKRKVAVMSNHQHFAVSTGIILCGVATPPFGS